MERQINIDQNTDWLIQMFSNWSRNVLKTGDCFFFIQFQLNSKMNVCKFFATRFVTIP